MSVWDEMLAQLASVPHLPGARCVGSHDVYDATASADGSSPDAIATRDYARAAARELCASCPALASCGAWFDSLPRRTRPRGVVAGRINTERL